MGDIIRIRPTVDGSMSVWHSIQVDEMVVCLESFNNARGGLKLGVEKASWCFRKRKRWWEVEEAPVECLQGEGGGGKLRRKA